MKDIKEAFLSPAILKHFKPSWRTFLQTDASNYAMGAVLSQMDEKGREWVISFASKILKPAQQNYSVTEKECLACRMGHRTFQDYLAGHPI